MGQCSGPSLEESFHLDLVATVFSKCLLVCFAVLDTNNVLVKMQIFELLSGLCIYSESGYSIAMDALADYKVECIVT